MNFEYISDKFVKISNIKERTTKKENSTKVLWIYVKKKILIIKYFPVLTRKRREIVQFTKYQKYGYTKH